jgi:gliding motility-associated lipoprotein GldH
MMISLIRKSGIKFWGIVFTAIVFFSSCEPTNLFEHNTNIPNLKWKSDFAATGSFNIADTISLYNVYVVMRHTDAYAYNNVWLNIGLQAPSDSLRYQRKNILLATDAKGWEGIGMNDIWETRTLLTEQPKRFLRTGLYTYSIMQIMRDNPLPHMMSVGIRLEKVQ